MTSFIDIADILARHRPLLLDLPTHTRGAVALVLAAGTEGLEMLFIERASRPDDPWSGDLGFPGGRMQEGEDDLRLTAERETSEEIGLDLRKGQYLGRLSDISGARLPVLVACFVYAIGVRPLIVFNQEISDACWISLADLISPERHVTARVRFGGKVFDSPAIRLPNPDKPVLWGITYRFVMEFLSLLRRERS